MKNLTKIFMAVVAMFAVSCATDPIEDLGVNLGEGQTTTLTLSLEGTKTYLGSIDGEEYPLYWSEGDKISWNGTESLALPASANGKQSATFTFAGKLGTPYCIAYPAAPAGQVFFAEEQTHTNDTTFGKGVATMYGYSVDGSNLTLNHLTGVLKIGVTGNGEKLTLAQISTVDRTPIAGAFDFDFKKGEATATTTSKDVISYSFGEGVTLSSKATYMHIAVPAGVYDELFVTLYTKDGKVMYKKAKAGNSNPLTAGTVRAFTENILFTPNNDAVHVIKDVASLKAFAAAAPTLTKDAVFVDDVDMSGEAWTPIEGYTKTINGNGYAIEGLCAPLFGTTSAKIKGLHLTKLNAEWTTLAHGGAFACELTEGGLLSHCSTDGDIIVNNTTYATTQVKANKDIAYGGLVGLASSSTIEHCVNKANMTFKSIAATVTTYAPSLGGIVGATDFAADSTTACSISHVTNKGKMYIENQLCTGLIDWGGVIGVNLTVGALAEFNYAENYGKLYNNPGINFNIQMGGVFGNLSSVNGEYFGAENATHWHNYGDIDIQGYGVTSNACISGVGRTFSLTGELSDVLNKGKINVSYSSRTLYVSGTTLGFYAGSASKIQNKGDITISTYDAERKIATLYATGWCNNCYATINGTSTDKCGNSGDITIDVACTGALYATGTAVKFTKAITHLVNSGNITVSGSIEGDAFISGIANTISGTLTDVTNNGKLTTTATHTGTVRIGGIISDTFSGTNVTRAINTGALEMHGSASSSIGVAGMWPVNQTADVVFTECHNRGSISVANKATSAGTCHTAGLVGYSNKTTTFDGCSNTAESIRVDNTTSHGYVSVAGAIGWCYNNEVIFQNGFTNSANIYAKPTQTYKYHASLGLPVGGVVAIYHKAGAAFDWSGEIKNTGTITFEGGATAARLGVGGIVGISNATAACNATLRNTGNITINKDTATIPETHGFGGIFGITAGPINNARSFCTITAIGVEANIGFITGSAYSDAIKATNCHIGGKLIPHVVDNNNPPIEIDSSIFNDHIYSDMLSVDEANEAKCGWLEKNIDSAPKNADGNVIVLE